MNREPDMEQPTPADAGGEQPKTYVAGDGPKEARRVPLAAAVGAVVTAVILAVLVTFGLTTLYRSDDPGTLTPGQGREPAFEELATIDKLFRSLTIRELDDEAIGTAILKAYVEATGDKYAEYFTAEEYAAQVSEQNGEMCGIGVTVINGTVESGGVTYQAVIVANVYPDSPAEKAGVLPGDAIMSVGAGEAAADVDDVGYTEALNRMRGEEGTEAVFGVWRPTRGADGSVTYESLSFTAVRRKLTKSLVTYRLCTVDDRVGVVKMTGFDNPTAPQFAEAMDALITAGCDAFVIDLRGNPGGLLTSVEDVLTFFLSEGDVMLSTRAKDGTTETYTVTVADGKVTSGSGQYTSGDVGRYKGYPVCVLVNENSASAAELMTANFRDHHLGTVIGTTTYGKGTMQTTYSLSRYGYDGALKLTTRWYDPPCGVSYEGTGITPDRVVELSEEALTYNINLLPDDKDDQLLAAVAVLRP